MVMYIPVLIQGPFPHHSHPGVPQERKHCVGEYLISQQVPDRRVDRPGIGFPDVEAEALPTLEGASSCVPYPLLSPEIFPTRELHRIHDTQCAMHGACVGGFVVVGAHVHT